MNRLAGTTSVDSTIQTPVTIEKSSPMMLSGAPVDLLNYFNIDVRNLTDRTRNQLNDIYSFLNSSSEGDGIFRSIRNIEMKLGSSSVGETRYGKIWSYLKVNNQIKKLEDEKRALER